MGLSYGEVLTSYSTGTATGTSEAGFLGNDDGASITNSYWDLDTSGLDNGCSYGDCSGVTGLTDVQLKSGLPAGFDPKIWGQSPNINNGYPYLRANPPQ